MNQQEFQLPAGTYKEYQIPKRSGGFRKITTQTRRGAQQGPGLVSLGLCRFVLRLGRLEGGIVAFCRFVERGQALGLGGACKGGHHGQCQGQGAQFHGGSF